MTDLLFSVLIIWNLYLTWKSFQSRKIDDGILEVLDSWYDGMQVLIEEKERGENE